MEKFNSHPVVEGVLSPMGKPKSHPQGSGCDLGFPIGSGPAKTLQDASGFRVRLGCESFPTSHRI